MVFSARRALSSQPASNRVLRASQAIDEGAATHGLTKNPALAMNAERASASYSRSDVTLTVDARASGGYIISVTGELGNVTLTVDGGPPSIPIALHEGVMRKKPVTRDEVRVHHYEV